MTWLNEILGATQGALARAAQTWRGKLGLAVIFLATLAIIAFLNPIRESRDLHEPVQVESAYWQKPLTCRGPDFREPPADPDSAPDEPRAIFRMSDRVVLAIPRHFLGGPWDGDEHLPTTIASCRSIRDLPQIQHLSIRITGRWSGTFNERELPKDNNGDVEYPDQLHLDVLPPDVRPDWAVQKPVWNRAFINALATGPLVMRENGILCEHWCWFPVPGEDDLYGPFQPLGGGSTELNLTPILIRGVPYLGLEISGRVMLRDVYRMLPTVILSVQDHLDRWNIVRPKEREKRPTFVTRVNANVLSFGKSALDRSDDAGRMGGRQCNIN